MENLNRLINRGLKAIKPYVPGKSILEVVREKGLTDVVKMASNENPLGVSPKALVAMEQAVRDSFVYPEVTSIELREALGEKFAVPAENFFVGNGADGVIYSLIMSFVEDEDEVILPEITFPMYETVILSMRGKIVFSPLKELAIDLEDILARITPRTKMIWICNPNNPTGLVIPRDELLDFFKKVPKDVLIVHDEVYYDFADPGTIPDTVKLFLEGQSNLFLLRSFSKVYGLAGARVGYGIGDKELINMLYRVKPPFEVSVIAQKGAIAALEDDEFYNRTRELTSRGKEFLYKELTALGLKYVPSGTNFILIDLNRDCIPVYEGLLGEGIIVRPARNYHLPTCIRVTVGTEEQNHRFISSVKRVLEALG